MIFLIKKLICKNIVKNCNLGIEFLFQVWYYVYSKGGIEKIMEGRNGNTVLLTVIGVATLLVALVGATFAYFTATVENGASQSISIVTATPVALTTNGGTAVSIVDAVPSQEGKSFGSVTMTVLNPASSTVTQTYDMTVKIDANQFTTGTTDTNDTAADMSGQLYLNVTETTDNTGKTHLKVGSATATDVHTSSAKTANTSSLPYSVEWDMTAGDTTAKQIADDQEIFRGETQSFTMRLAFIDINKNQNANSSGKTFMAHMEMSDIKATSNATEKN